MTGQLRTTLHARADELGAGELDLDAIVRGGERRLRRRRVAVAGTVASVLALVGVATALVGRDHSTHPRPTDQDVRSLTYAVGTVIHSGSSLIDVGVQVQAVVRVDGGFVFSGPDRTVYLEQGGDTQPLGRLADSSSPLFASDDGLVAAWWDGESIQSWPGYHPSRSGPVPTDDKTNSFGVARTWPSGSPPHVEAVSDGHLWFWDGQDTWTTEVRPLTTSAGWKDSGFTDGQMIRSAAGDKLLIRVGGGLAVIRANLLPAPGDPGWADWEPGTDVSSVPASVPDVSDGVLSPDGEHWFATGTSRFVVFDSASGDRQAPSHDGFLQVTPYAWLGDDTIAAVARTTTDDHDVSLLTCQVSSKTCRVAASDVGPHGDVVVANGLPAERR